MRVMHLLSAIAAPRRREILRLVSERPRSVGELHHALSEVSPLSRPAVSQHLRVLREVGAVRVDRVGRERRYHLDADALGPLVAVLESMWDDALDRLRVQAEIEHARRGPRSRAAGEGA